MDIKLLKVNFYNLGTVENEKLKYAVIVARYKDKWIYVRHKDRKTWEVTGGHREPFEKIEDTASRELYEESGAKEFKLIPICIYSVSGDEEESFGQLYYAEVQMLGELPQLEIAEVRLMDDIPELDKLTYPLIQPYLFKKVTEFLENQGTFK